MKPIHALRVSLWGWFETVHAVRDESRSPTEQRSVPHDSIYFSDKHLLCLSLFQMFDAAARPLFCQVQQAWTSGNTETFTHGQSPMKQLQLSEHTHPSIH